MLKMDLEPAIKAVKKKKAKLVAIQIPEGLKQRTLEIASKIEEKTGAETFTFMDPCFGACDIADSRAKAMDADILIHFGHSRFVPKEELETVYIPLHYSLKKSALKALAEGISKKAKKGKTIALCTTIQYLDYLPEFKKILKTKGFKIEIGKGKNVLQGQVLGCNYSSVKAVEKKVDSVVFLGDGLFHPIGISFTSKKPVFTANPHSLEVNKLESERDLFLRKRSAAIARAMDAKTFGILVSDKKGQAKKELAFALKKKIEKSGRKAFVLVADYIKPEYILGVGLDALVGTACPRIVFDDASSFKQPILSASELDILLGQKKFGQYKIEELN